VSEQSSVREALEKALQDGLHALKDALDLPALEALRNTYLSKKGIFTAHMQELAKARAEERPQLGKIINDAKTHFQQALQEKIDAFRAREMAEKLAAERVDVTLAGRQTFQGGLHPVTLTRRRIEDWFARLGFVVEDGPEIEDDFHNFTALNIPEHHPARAMQDTFYFDPKTVLRTHTSSVQTRTMLSSEPPIRIICPGRVYRNEAISYRAHCFFHQVEALYIDQNVSFADLKQVLLYFAQELFGTDTKIRLRPSYFPFTEPSAEMDISCNICGGTGCNFCKHTGWVEILGCGMVDPNVLENCGIDSKKYSGYALGMGIERITNLKYRVSDLRLFSENDVRFLEQFKGAGR